VSRAAIQEFMMTKIRTWRDGLIVSILTVAVLAVGCSSVRKVETRSDDPEALARIQHRLQDVLDAAVRKDFDRLESYHLYGPQFTRFSTSSATRQDAASTRQLEREGLALLAGLQMRADDLKIDVFGKTAITTFILDYKFDTKAGTIRSKERATLVFVNKNGDWKIVHEHLSTITPADTSAANVAPAVDSETNRGRQ